MASALAHDVGMYCLSKGSTIFYCSLDAEGAYDALPHSVLLQKTMNIIPDNLWHLLHFWYSHMNVVIRWGNHISNNVVIEKGMRQGGFTSPPIFNMYDKGLIEKLQSSNHGVTIGRKHFNALCCADDILLCSTSVTGLQELLNMSKPVQ